jgi:hypothetical protein
MYDETVCIICDDPFCCCSPSANAPPFLPTPISLGAPKNKNIGYTITSINYQKGLDMLQSMYLVCVTSSFLALYILDCKIENKYRLR